jgi:hypothetical protein
VTHSGGKPHQVGDRGQRYEISCFDQVSKERIVIGWTNDAETAADMRAGAEMRPTWCECQVKDRRSQP